MTDEDGMTRVPVAPPYVVPGTIATASVADVLFFESLPADTQTRLIRLFGHDPRDPDLLTGDEVELEEAYEAGFQEAIDQMEPPDLDTADFAGWLKSRRRA
jgi:hypothetical protein